MGSIPGKSCGPCTMCCKVLVIDHFKKDAGVLCENCTLKGGCKIYDTRPDVCGNHRLVKLFTFQLLRGLDCCHKNRCVRVRARVCA